jgi:hypothetical protein
MTMRHGSPWLHGRQEPELRSLAEWLDTRASVQQNSRDGGIIGGVSGSLFGLAGAAIGVMAGGFDLQPEIYPMVIVGPLVVASLGTALTAFLVVSRRTPAEREARRAQASSRGFIWQLSMARWQGNLKEFLGEDRALLLNEGAHAYLRMKSALESPAWRAVAPDTEFAATRERTAIAMEVAMARLVTSIGQGALATAPEVRRLVADMGEAANEAARTADRLARDAGQPGDASDHLRQVLSEMRLLNSAQDEIDRLRDRSR